MGYIYKTTCLLNNKIYIGKFTKNYPYYLGSGIHFKKAMSLYGKENFIKEILESDIEDHEILCEREIFWISHYNATNPDIGYNISHGGQGAFGYKHTEEHNNKIAEAQKGEKSYWWGKKRSEKTKRKISENSNVVISDAQKKLLSEKLTGISKGRISDDKKISKYRGVTKDKYGWIARLQKNGIRYNLGRHETEYAAAVAYDKKAMELGDKTLKLNILSWENI
jgi:group I intron endonuclease